MAKGTQASNYKLSPEMDARYREALKKDGVLKSIKGRKLRAIADANRKLIRRRAVIKLRFVKADRLHGFREQKRIHDAKSAAYARKLQKADIFYSNKIEQAKKGHIPGSNNDNKEQHVNSHQGQENRHLQNPV